MIPPRFAPVREVPPLFGVTPGGATGTPAVVIDLAPVHDRSSPARLLDMVPSRSKKALKNWLTARDEPWKQTAQGSRAPPERSSPRPGRSWTPFHVVSLACRQARPVPPHPVGRPQGAGAGQETGSTGPGTRCTPAPTCSPIPRPGTLRPCSPTSATLRSMPAGAFTSALSRPTGSRTRAWEST